MTDKTTQTAKDDPQLTQRASEPQGVIRKNIKVCVYLGAILLLIGASLISSKKKPTNTPAKGTPPQPYVQDNTATNVAELQNQLAAEKQKEQQDAQMAAAMAANQTPAQQQAATLYGPNGQPMPPQAYPQTQQQNAQPQLSPEQQQQQQLASKEREMAFTSRFSSNLAYSRSIEEEQRSVQRTSSQSSPQTASGNPYAAALAGGQNSSLTPTRQIGEQPSQASGEAAAPAKRPVEVNLDTAVGQPYVTFEGTTLDTVLMNRLDGDAPGPVKVLVSNPLYSHDHQHVLIPDGTIVLGEAKKIGSAGFGQQRRMAVVFHRLIMPDGFSVDLDQFHGLDQIGEEGLKDKVNNHYLEIFGTSIALGVIAGAGEITQGGGTISTSGQQAFTSGTAASVSQSATSILDRFIQIPPTITIREGHRVKVYFTQDMLLPAYTNHTIPQSF